LLERAVSLKAPKGTPMPSDADSAHLNSHHRATLDKIFEHPTSRNIEWHDVVSLMGAVATISEQHDGKWLVTLGSETQTLETPKHKDIDVQMVVDLRRMLGAAGYAPGTESSTD
jgi:hypothetical protein